MASRLPELSALGAVMSGFLGMNVYTSISELDNLPHTFEDYHPVLDDKTVQHYYDGWRAAVQQVLL